MITSKFELDNGITLDSAYFVLSFAMLHSHTVTIEDVTTEQQDIECRFNVYSSESAYTDKKPSVTSIERIFPYNKEVLLEEQAYSALVAELEA